MRQEIQKILEMTQSGKLTQEQAAQLIEELKSDASKTESGENEEAGASEDEHCRFGGRRSHGHRGWGRHGHMHGHGNPIKAAIKGMFFGEGWDNACNFSKMESPSGEGFVFKDNSVHLSSMTKLKLFQSEMSQNAVKASKVEELEIRDGKFVDCGVYGSALEEFKIENSELRGVSFRGTKCSETYVHAESRLQDVEIVGSKLTEVVFENCQFDKMLFAECRLKNVVIRNVTLGEIKVRGVDLRGQVIDGNEAFQKALDLIGRG